MKAVSVVSSGGGGVSAGRVSRRRDIENEEIQTYLSKLKELVPFMPKNRKLSKLEVIEYVIDYICDLQDALVDGQLVPRHSPLSSASPVAHSRTPLGVLAPNTILSPCSSQEQTVNVLSLEKTSSSITTPATTPSSTTVSDKPTLRPTRPVSC